MLCVRCTQRKCTLPLRDRFGCSRRRENGAAMFVRTHPPFHSLPPSVRRNVARRMTGYRQTRYTGRTVRHVGASRTCSICAARTQISIIYRDHLPPCPHVACRRIARPTPGPLSSIRSRCPPGHSSYTPSTLMLSHDGGVLA